MYFFIVSSGIIFITAYFLKYDPELIKRRLAAGPGAEKEKTQKTIQTISGVLVIALIIFSGVNQHFQGIRIPTVLTFISDFFVAAGFFIVFLVFRENTFTSAVVEVDKKQKVISTGPYSIVRHPMYAGSALLFLFTPFALNSFWAIPIGILLVFMLIVRLLDEEKLLLKDLPGYKEYCRKTKYHLVPFIW
jgi:protein-S-isoprenylcysteine O-methyltransferase Ste14